MSKQVLKKLGIFAGVVVLFLVIAYSFVPQVLTGKVVNQSDISGYMSMSHQTVEWNKAHEGQESYWTDAMFGGMPTTSFMPSHEGDLTQPLYNLLLSGKRPASYLFLSLLGAFLLLLSLGVDTIIAIGGAVAVTFCSYNLQIIQVGHNTKMQALAFLPWVLAAVIFTYRSCIKGKSLREWLPYSIIGSVLFGLSMSMQVKANHQQITYYLALMIALYVLTFFIWLLVSKERRALVTRFLAASAMLLVMGLAGIGTNAVKLAPLYEYTAHTMRGGTELSSSLGKTEVNESGLQLDYATAWSYSQQELPNLLIPDYNGGSSAGSMDPSKSAVVKVCEEAGIPSREVADSLPLYWGPQPFTAGPMYMGAITVFLFLLGLFLYEGKEKWWLLAATVLAVCLGLGRNMMWFTKFFFDYVPMYNKFRTVSMALVILQYSLPVLGFLTLDRIMKCGYSRKDFLVDGLVALALTAGFCLLVVLMPGLVGDFVGPSDGQLPEAVADALRVDRAHLMMTDAIRSMILVVAAFLLILWGYSIPKSAEETYESDPHIGKARRVEAVIGISILVLIDLFSVGHRYLNSSDFTSARSFYGQFKKRTVDDIILTDSTLSYRVADLTTDPFNDMFNSYFHKNVGGYSPAKLQRFQDLIERYLSKEISSAVSVISKCQTFREANENLPYLPVLSALNCKYLIFNSEYAPVWNRFANGNAWFIDSVKVASTPDEEIEGIGEVDMYEAAVIGDDFSSSREAVMEALSKVQVSEADSIVMTSYAPGELHYTYSVKSDRPAVFSEVYYPEGWSATVDGAPLDIFRCDWVLRGALLPAGDHELVMKFCPDVYAKGKAVSAASSWLLILLVAGSLGWIVVSGKKKEEPEISEGNEDER